MKLFARSVGIGISVGLVPVVAVIGLARIFKSDLDPTVVSIVAIGLGLVVSAWVRSRIRKHKQSI